MILTHTQFMQFENMLQWHQKTCTNRNNDKNKGEKLQQNWICQQKKPSDICEESKDTAND